MFRNQAGTVKVFAFNRATNAPVLNDAANLSCKYSLNNATPQPLADTSAAEIEDGFYLFSVTADETNGTTVDFFPQSSTPGVQVICVEHIRYLTQPAATSAETEEILAAVTVANEILEAVQAKTQLITAGRIRVVSRADGSTIAPKAGDDHTIDTDSAVWLSVDDETGDIFTFLTDPTHTAVEFGAAREGRADEITSDINVQEIYRDASQTMIPIEFSGTQTAAKPPVEYRFDIQVTTATGARITRPELTGTMNLEPDYKSR